MQWISCYPLDKSYIFTFLSTGLQLQMTLCCSIPSAILLWKLITAIKSQQSNLLHTIISFNWLPCLIQMVVWLLMRDSTVTWQVITTLSNLQFLPTPSQNVTLVSFNRCLDNNHTHPVTQAYRLISWKNDTENNQIPEELHWLPMRDQLW